MGLIEENDPIVRHHLLTSLLRDVSRSFYLTLRVLPAPVGTQIELAYLLARATDTIADTEIVPLEKRLAALTHLRGRILGQTTEPLSFGDLANEQSNPAEQLLLKRIEEAIQVLNQQNPSDILLIRHVLTTITSGQELDLHRFGNAPTAAVVALATWAELDDYTYRVAGCVGEFWTECCLQNLPKAPVDRRSELLENGIRFGKGLQLTNILRDLPKDLRIGRCYLPAEELWNHGLLPQDLLDPANSVRFADFYATMLDRAEAHLRAGWDYTNALPWRWMRVRLACAWPVLIGLATLDKLRHSNVLDVRHRIKLSRTEVRIILIKTFCLYLFPKVWHGLGDPKKSR